jgi:hypothetical protein
MQLFLWKRGKQLGNYPSLILLGAGRVEGGKRFTTESADPVDKAWGNLPEGIASADVLVYNSFGRSDIR